MSQEENGEPETKYYGPVLFQIGYVLPHFSFSIVFLEFLTKGGASAIGFNVALAWITLILQTPLYLTLYLYLDAIVPNRFGIALKCCFCLKKQAQREEERVEEHEIELIQGTKNPIVTKNLSMEFEKIKAVQDFSLSIEQNQVISLLGHNGAGKTTIINMLTGILKPT